VLKAGGLQAPFLLTHNLEGLEQFGRHHEDQNGGRLHRVALDVDGVTGRDGESLHEVGGHTGLESAVAVLEDEDVLEGGHRVDAQRGAEAHHLLDGGRITCDVLRHQLRLREPCCFGGIHLAGRATDKLSHACLCFRACSCVVFSAAWCRVLVSPLYHYLAAQPRPNRAREALGV